MDNLTVSATYGYMDSKFKNVYLPNASVDTLVDGQTVDLRNQETSATYRYTSDQRGGLEPYAIQPAAGLLDGTLTWVSAGRNYEISLWGENLANRV